MSSTSPKIALVTGASRGLGAALAEQLALTGWHVVAVARTTGGLESLDDRVKAQNSSRRGLPGAGGLTLAPMDITNEDAMAHLAASISARWGQLGFWAHTAIHATALAPASSIDLKDLDKSIAANLRATSHLITLVEPLLRAGKGIALIPDDPFPGSANAAAYGATKAGQIALARAWAQETRRIGPKVVIAAPMPMPTALRARFHPGEDRAALTDPKAEAIRLLALALS